MNIHGIRLAFAPKTPYIDNELLMLSIEVLDNSSGEIESIDYQLAYSGRSGTLSLHRSKHEEMEYEVFLEPKQVIFKTRDKDKTYRIEREKGSCSYRKAVKMWLDHIKKEFLPNISGRQHASLKMIINKLGVKLVKGIPKKCRPQRPGMKI